MISTLPYKNIIQETRKGFILPFTMLLVAIILLVVGTGSTVLSKQLFFSKIYRQSQTAYYAADDALGCAIAIDDGFIGEEGYGIFPGGTADDPTTYINDVIDHVNTARLNAGLLTISKEEIECSQVAILDPAVSEFEVALEDYEHNGTFGIETGKTSTFSMRMPLGDGTFRCADVTVNKTPTFRQVIAQGYAVCNSPLGTVERAVVNSTIIE